MSIQESRDRHGITMAILGACIAIRPEGLRLPWFGWTRSYFKGWTRSEFQKTVRTYLGQGYRKIGMVSVRSQYFVDPYEIKKLAADKGAHLVVGCWFTARRRDRKHGKSITGISSSIKPVYRRGAQFHRCLFLFRFGRLLPLSRLARRTCVSPVHTDFCSASHVWIHSMSHFFYLPVLMALSVVLFLGGCAQTPSTRAPGGIGHFSTVVIDAGHGGKDSGGVSRRGASIFLREKDLTLDTAKRVRDELRRAGLRTLMMREDDHFVELDDRVSFANRQGRGAVLVSIHYDAVSSNAPHGAKTFFWRADSHGLATRIQQQLDCGNGRSGSGCDSTSLEAHS